MLILERKSNEAIIIQTPDGNTIKIHMIDTTRGKVKVGIDAPDDHLILREELLDEETE